jgi:hypothetical protein
VLTVCLCKTFLEDDPSIVAFLFLIPMAAGTREPFCCKYIGVTHTNMMSCSNGISTCFIIVHWVLNLFEHSFHWLMGIPRIAHGLEVVIQIQWGDAAISGKYILKHLTIRGVRKSNHVVIRNIKVHWFKYHSDLLFEDLSNVAEGFESIVILLPLAVCMTYMMLSCALRMVGPCPGFYGSVHATPVETTEYDIAETMRTRGPKSPFPT